MAHEGVEVCSSELWADVSHIGCGGEFTLLYIENDCEIIGMVQTRSIFSTECGIHQKISFQVI
jgi:hypothetical protein